MKQISKGEVTPHDGVILTLREYEDYLKDKTILEELSKIIKK